MSHVCRLNEEWSRYADKWSSINAEQFESGGHYDWMASFVDGKTRVLEIGTGDGRGTLALLARDHALVSVDENAACLAKAERRLREAGVEFRIDYRGQVHELKDCYRIDYGHPNGQVPAPGQALLLQGDTVSDDKLISWLSKVGPFDAVVCWLIGTHHARIGNRAIWDSDVRSPGCYRLLVQNGVYELADRILAPGGLLHVVDRGQAVIDDNHLREDHIASHRDQARVTSLEFQSYDERLYEEPDETGGVGTEITLGESGHMPDSMVLALKSVVFRRP